MAMATMATAVKLKLTVLMTVSVANVTAQPALTNPPPLLQHLLLLPLTLPAPLDPLA
jgi:hypothetical protein